MRETPDIETSTAGYASRFAGSAGRYLIDVQTRAIERALEGLQVGTALDVGGGHGQLVSPLKRLGWSVTVHGTDPVCGRNLHELHGHAGTDFVCSDLFALPFPDQSFDLVIAVRLISHVEDWKRLLREMTRVARHAVVLDYPSRFALNALTPLMFGLKKSFEGNTRTYTSFSRAELADALAESNFEVERERKQFFMPMVVHRAAKGAAPARWMESLFRVSGATAVAGSPVILRADRVAGN